MQSRRSPICKLLALELATRRFNPIGEDGSIKRAPLTYLTASDRVRDGGGKHRWLATAGRGRRHEHPADRGSDRARPLGRLGVVTLRRAAAAILIAAIPTSVGLAKAGGSQQTGKIAVICLVRDPLAYQICSLNPDGSGWRLLTRGPEKIDSTDPDFSPDGTKIVFVRGPNGGKTDVYVMNADGTGARQLTHCSNCYGEDTPTYSPNGDTIAFHRDPRTSRGGIFLMRADGRRVRQLTREICDCYDGEPSFAPGGKRLVFARYQNAKHLGALFTVDLRGGRLHRITSWALGAGLPDWSPNGKLITFNSYNEDLRPGRSLNIYTVHPDGNGLHALTRAKGGVELDYRPSWSPDGNWIAFTHEPNAQATPGIHGDQNVDIMRADGTEIRRIAATPHGGRTSDWGK